MSLQAHYSGVPPQGEKMIEFLKAFMNGGWLIDFASWMWHTIFIGWTTGLWNWYLACKEVPGFLYLDVIGSFCIAIFLILCIWFLLSIIALSIWVGCLVTWLFAWCIYLIAIVIIWFCVDILWALAVWIWPFLWSLLIILGKGAWFLLKWIVILFVLPVIGAGALKTLEQDNKINSIWYVLAWEAYTATLIVALPLGWFFFYMLQTVLWFIFSETKPQTAVN